MRFTRGEFLSIFGFGAAAVKRLTARPSEVQIPEGSHLTPEELGDLTNVDPNMVRPAYSKLGRYYDHPVLDVVSSRLYDRFRWSPGDWIPSRFDAFENVGPASGKTMADCNVCKPGSLPMPEAFWIDSLNFVTDERIADEDWDILKGISWRLILGSRIYDYGTLFGDVQRRYLGQDQESMLYWLSHSSYRARESREYGPLGHGILQNQYFTVSFSGPSQRTSEKGNGVDLLVQLEGIHIRGVS